MALALGASKSWRQATSVWQRDPPGGELEHALAAEASIGCGRLEDAQGFLENVNGFGDSLQWIRRIRQTIQDVNELRKSDGGGPASRPLNAPYGAWLLRVLKFEEAIEYWNELREGELVPIAKAQHHIARSYFFIGEFQTADAIASELASRQGGDAAADEYRDEARKISRNCSTRLKQPPETGKGADYWYRRHPLYVELTQTSAYKGDDDDASALLQLIEFLGAAESISEIVGRRSLSDRSLRRAISCSPRMTRELLRDICGLLPERSARENHCLALSLLEANRLDLLSVPFSRS